MYSVTMEQMNLNIGVHGVQVIIFAKKRKYGLTGFLAQIRFTSRLSMLEHFTDVDFDVERLQRKWGEIVICKIKLSGQNIHELTCGFAMSEWAAKQTRSYDLTYDHETGRTHRKLVTNFTQFPTIKPQDYEILAKFLDLPSLKSTEFTGGLKNADGVYLPLWECFK